MQLGRSDYIFNDFRSLSSGPGISQNDIDPLTNALLEINTDFTGLLAKANDNFASIRSCYSISLDYEVSQAILKKSLKHVAFMVLGALLVTTFQFSVPLALAAFKGQAIAPIINQMYAWILHCSPAIFLEILISSTFLLRPLILLTLSSLLILLIPILELSVSGTADKISPLDRLMVFLKVEGGSAIKLCKIIISIIFQAILLTPMPLILLFRAFHCALCVLVPQIKNGASCAASSMIRLFKATSTALPFDCLPKINSVALK